MIIFGRTQAVLRSAWQWLAGAAATAGGKGEVIEVLFHATAAIAQSLYVDTGRSILLHTAADPGPVLYVGPDKNLTLHATPARVVTLEA